MMRRFVGNHGYSHPLAGQMLVQLYRTLRLYVNYFQPSFKLLEKSREGSGRVKRDSPPATPSDRLLQHQAVSYETKGQLTRDRASVDPAALLHAIREPRAALVAVSSPDHGEPARQESLEQFLSLLPPLWQQDENRPTRAPRTRGPRHWRTRPDPFDGVWQDILGWLETEPDITARKILDRLCSEQPSRFSDHHLLTLRWEVRQWGRVWPGSRSMPAWDNRYRYFLRPSKVALLEQELDPLLGNIFSLRNRQAKLIVVDQFSLRLTSQSTF